MSAITSSKTLRFTIEDKITFSGLSNLSGDQSHILTSNVYGGWRLKAVIPKAPLADEKTGLGLFVFPPWGRSDQGIWSDGIEVTLSIESLKGEKQVSGTFSWNLTTSLQGRGCNGIIDWNEFWHKNADHRRDDGFCVIVTITSPRPDSDRRMFQNLCLTISELTKGSDVFDTQFLVFSQPRQYNGVYGAQNPLPVYASCAFLRSQCGYFDAMFSDSAYSESRLWPFDRTPDAEWVQRYDYESDSDLGYFSDDEHSGRSLIITEASESSDNRVLPLITQETTHKNMPEVPQFSEQMMDNKPEENTSALHHPNRQAFIKRMGKVVSVKDIAYVTWRAMIFYLMTKQIAFAPLSSRQRSRARSVLERRRGLPSKPSAKSMFRLADKLGVDELRKLSLTNIQSQLSTDIIFKELFSGFTSRYKDVQDLQLAFVSDHWDALKSSPKLDEIIQEVTCGDLPHASDVLKAMLTRR